MKNIIVKLTILIISILDKIIPKNKNSVVYNSFPDLSDNSFGLFIHIIEKYPKKKNIWLIKEGDFESYKLLINNYTKSKNYKLIKRDSVLGIYYYLRSKYIFFTHGLYGSSKISKDHCVVNLWHGMPLKNIGLLEKETISQKSTFIISTSSFYQNIMEKAFNINTKNVLISGQPRNDFLFKPNNCLEKLGLKIDSKNRLILWTPTYRESIIGDIRIDGKFSNDLPVIKLNELESLNKYLITIKSYLIIKLHPMDILNKNKFINYSNIKILKKDDLQIAGYQLNSLLYNVDILLTDFSSIYIDYLLLNRPIGFVIDDFSEYSNSRGFVFNNAFDYMPGETIGNFNELKSFLHKNIIDNTDDYFEKRKKVNDKLNKNFTCYSEEVLKGINFI